MCDNVSSARILYLTTPIISGVAPLGLIGLARAAHHPDVTICTSWDQMLSEVGQCRGDTLVIFDTNYLNRETISPSEITAMLSTIFKCVQVTCAPESHKISFALYTNAQCQPDEVKSLKSSDVLGIIPGSMLATFERQIEIFDAIVAAKQCWPKEAIAASAKKLESPGIRLTTRQSQVLALVCNRGLSNKKIASLLKISESTVKIHVSAILKEYGVRNRTQLALAARESLHA